LYPHRTTYIVKQKPVTNKQYQQYKRLHDTIVTLFSYWFLNNCSDDAQITSEMLQENTNPNHRLNTQAPSSKVSAEKASG
jgi:hypothetical protein